MFIGINIRMQVRLLDIELFGSCNLACPMCPQATGREKDFRKALKWDVFTKVVDEAMQYGLEAVMLHGSGEPTLSPIFLDAIEYVKERNLRCVVFTNAMRLTEKLAQGAVDRGLDVLRASLIGYDKPTFEHWMKGAHFETVQENLLRFSQIAEGTQTELHSNHLIIDQAKVDFEIDAYKQTWIEPLNSQAEIWLMHNWGGQLNDLPYMRRGKVRSCGRPFKPVLTVRAGGLDGHYGALVACPEVLGRDSKGTMGHLDTQSIDEAWNSEAFEKLRDAHRTNQYEGTICDGCDQLYEVPESLVWTNIEGRKYNQSKALQNFSFR